MTDPINTAAPQNGPMISVSGLTKRFAGVAAVDRISFEVERGEVLGFLGPNGAGKTTTMRMLASYFPPTEGSVRVGGHDAVAESQAVRQLVGYMPESVPLYPDLRVQEYLTFRAKLKGVPARDRKARLDATLDRCLLADVRRKIVGHLSKGYRQRVGLADALINDPPILILDEPTIGLDPNQIRSTRALVKELGRDHTVILSTHILPEVEMVCRRVIIIARGKIVAGDSVEALRTGVGPSGVRLEARGDLARMEAALRALPGATGVDRRGSDGDRHRLLVRQGAGADLREAIHAEAVRSGWSVRELALEALTLDEIFGRITAGEETPDLAKKE